MTDLYTTLSALVLQTNETHMFTDYGADRWEENILELLQAEYTTDAIQWIMASKIARWANDAEMTILDYINAYVGDAKLRTWMRDYPLPTWMNGYSL